MRLCEWCNEVPVRTAKRRFCSYRCASFARHQKLRDNNHVYVKHKYSDQMIVKGIELINTGMSWREASEISGVSVSSLQNRASSLDIKVRVGRQSAVHPMRLNIPTSEADRGYLAGILDGEGHITIEDGVKSKNRTVHVGITNTSKELMDYLGSIGGSVNWKSRDQSLGMKPCAVWYVVSRQDVLALLSALEPHMRIKREKALYAIELVTEWIASGINAQVQTASGGMSVNTCRVGGYP